jgi:nucleoside-diphosphate-sugar epimerase
MTDRVVAVSGASGFVGGVIARALAEAGCRVIALGRRPVDAYEHREYSLAVPVSDALLEGVDTVIHCAYDLSLTDARTIEAVNVQGTRSLVEVANRSAARVVLVSSMSAYAETKQIYGQAKLRSERIVLASAGEVLRLGLVWGADERGMIGTLRRLARLPVVPVFGRDLYQFMVHAEDVGVAFVKFVDDPPFGEPLGLAHPARVPFERILGYANDRRTPRLVRVPWTPTYGALRLAELARLPLPVRADSLLGLVRPATHVPNVEYWSEYGLQLTPFGSDPDSDWRAA